MADKRYNETIFNIYYQETKTIIYVDTCKGLSPIVMKKHVLFNQNIFEIILLFLPMQSLFQILPMRKIISIKNNLWENTSNRRTTITMVFVVMNARLFGVDFKES